MSSSIFLRTLIEKDCTMTQSAIEEVIALYVGSGRVDAYSSADNGMYTIAIRENEIFPNVKEMLLVITVKSKANRTESLLKTILTYELSNKSVHLRVLNTLFGKHLIKKQAIQFLSEFKKRVEKWI